MRVIKLAFLSVVFLLLFFTFISIFLPSNIRVSKAVEINNTKEQVMNELTNPVNWRNWYPGLDSAKLFYTDSIVNGVIVNEEKKQTIILKGIKDDEVMIEYHVSDKRKIAGGWKIISAENNEMVQWYMSFHVRWYPWEKFAGLLYEKSFGTQMKTGLNKLKEITEMK